MIKISSRLRPFSHRPTTLCLLPTTQYLVEAHPSLILIKTLSGEKVKELVLDIEGPLKQFTVMQDLERGCVTILSEQYRFHVLPNLEIVFRKNPSIPSPLAKERLSLGSHKKQEWEGIKKRCDFRELFPLWFRLGSLLQLPRRSEDERGVFSLLKNCREALSVHKPEFILPAFKKLFLAGFGNMFVPRLTDEDFQGILPEETATPDHSPLYLLTEGAELIRSLFLLSSGNEISLLPNLPPEFFAGRMINLSCGSYGEVDLEWSKKMIRRLNFRASTDGEIFFHFRSHIRSFRLRTHRAEKGKIYLNGDCLEIKSNTHYLLDQFQK